ncbi:conserved hypothetical protein [Methylocella silvestris BL2]|uniref:Uncharacterized protein n=1 Tax=Methylocella silvestris (strain DSM 15510 / CIP 108128 / LMG 27833 / NCIMB 13906 / BL2) TaxID=395965 RepID=B8EJY1_METSB|nr:hypothetical protein [Methylocella silvestris]ACK49928.1 conserved hypothetical protein [Methylocella silvestris BL2]
MKNVTVPLARIARRSATAALAVGACLSLTAGEANAGFFDFLFQQPPPQYSAPVYRPMHVAPHLKRRLVTRKPKSFADKPHTPARVVSNYLDDDSLQSGDAVMTSEGLRIFTGSSGLPHKTADFAKVSDIKRLSGRQRDALLAIDSRSANAQLLSGRSIAEPGVSTGEMIVDAKGAKIRYVGP